MATGINQDENASEVILSRTKTAKPIVLDVRKALRAICSTGKGRCWFCDQRLPTAEEAVSTGWDVQRVEGERVASIILVCPLCQSKPDDLSAAEKSLAARL
jgi:hypothetical protein